MRSNETTTPVTSAAETTSTSLGPVDDGGVLAAAVLWRATMVDGRSEPDRFSHLYIVERLGRDEADGFITGVESGRALTETERAAIEAALAPRTVEWVQSWDSVVDEQATTTLPEDRAIITVAEPLIDDDRAEVTIELWCGYMCATGSTLALEGSPSREWAVTDETVLWVA